MRRRTDTSVEKQKNQQEAVHRFKSKLWVRRQSGSPLPPGNCLTNACLPCQTNQVRSHNHTAIKSPKHPVKLKFGSFKHGPLFQTASRSDPKAQANRALARTDNFTDRSKHIDLKPRKQYSSACSYQRWFFFPTGPRIDPLLPLWRG